MPVGHKYDMPFVVTSTRRINMTNNLDFNALYFTVI